MAYNLTQYIHTHDAHTHTHTLRDRTLHTVAARLAGAISAEKLLRWTITSITVSVPLCSVCCQWCLGVVKISQKGGEPTGWPSSCLSSSSEQQQQQQRTRIVSPAFIGGDELSCVFPWYVCTRHTHAHACTYVHTYIRARGGERGKRGPARACISSR